jgi:hypothetical protein
MTAAVSEWSGTSLPVPAAKLAAAVRAVHDFISMYGNFDEKRWAAVDPFISGLFVRSGPWLYPTYPRAEHGRIFSSCLAAGILVSPDYDRPSFVPAEFDKGEISPLRSIPRP